MSVLTVTNVGNVGLIRQLTLVGGQVANSGTIDQIVVRSLENAVITLSVANEFINIDMIITVNETTSADSQITTFLSTNSTKIENLIASIQTWPADTDALLDKQYVFGTVETIPSVPTGLSTSVITPSAITFTWNTVATAAYYKLKVASVTGGPYIVIKPLIVGTTVVVTSDDLARNDLSGQDLQLTNQLFWVLSAVNKGGQTANSTELLLNPTQELDIPTGVTVQPGNGQNTVSWNAVTGALTYDVKSSSSSSGPFSVISDNQTATSFTDVPLTNGVTVFYTVSQNNGSLDSEESVVVSGAPVAVAAVPAVVSGLSGQAGDSEISLAWNSAAGATSYKVRRRVTQASSNTISITGIGSLADATDASTYATAAFIPPASELIVAAYTVARTGSATPIQPTLSGHGTWTLISAHNFIITNQTTRRSLYLFGLITGASPSSAALTFDHGGTTHHGAQASVFKIEGADEANGLAQTFVQSVKTVVDPATSGNPSITLAAAGNSTNRALSIWSMSGGAATDNNIPRPNWTEIHDDGINAPIGRHETQWRSDVFETIASISYPSSTAIHGGIAFEIKAGTQMTGTFVQIASTANLFHLDKTVTNGISYDYVIASSNSTGNAADSTQISKTPIAAPASASLFNMIIVGMDVDKPNFDALSPQLSNEKTGLNFPLRFIYGAAIGGLNDKTKFPTESGVKDGLAARLSSSYTGWLVYDLERFITSSEIHHLENIILWTKEQIPNVKLGFYGQVPKLRPNSFDTTSSNYASDHNANITWFASAIASVDGFFMGAYPDGNDLDVTWKRLTDAKIAEIGRLNPTNRPIRFVIRNNFIPGAKSRVNPPPIGTDISFDPLTKAQYRFMLTHLDTPAMRAKNVRGCLTWQNPGKAWAEMRTWGWWPATQEHFGFTSNI